MGGGPNNPIRSCRVETGISTSYNFAMTILKLRRKQKVVYWDISTPERYALVMQKLLLLYGPTPKELAGALGCERRLLTKYKKDIQKTKLLKLPTTFKLSRKLLRSRCRETQAAVNRLVKLKQLHKKARQGNAKAIAQFLDAYIPRYSREFDILVAQDPIVDRFSPQE